MELHGSLASNLQMALDSSTRLRGHPVHKDTVAFWSDLIGEARSRRAAGENLEDSGLDRLMADLEAAISEIKAETGAHAAPRC